MATTVHEPPKLNSHPPNHGGWHGIPPAARNRTAVEDSSPASRTGVWVGLAAITMTFAAFTSAMVVRQGASQDWQSFALPRILFVDTAVLLASSLTLEMARKRVAAFVHGAQGLHAAAARWLWLTLALGLLFVAGQYAAWLRLRAEGLYLATNPSSSFFYLLTAAHGLHILGGLVGLGLVIGRFARRAPTLRVSTLSTVAYYWHFMDVLWIYLLLLLWLRI